MSVPSHAGDGARDGGETGVDPPFPLEAFGDDRDAMQNAGVLADQCGSDAKRRARSTAMRARVFFVRIVLNLTVSLGPSRLAGESRGKDGA